MYKRRYKSQYYKCNENVKNKFIYPSTLKNNLMINDNNYQFVIGINVYVNCKVLIPVM